ncbi:MAG TPA: ABC transporter permease [Vicinamibacterales bacterium]|nr:ABC transporter permease [Vicinamibacterales bacterium]
MKRAVTVVSVLVGLHLLILLAGFVAPYDPTTQVRTLPFAPPSRIHFVDAAGIFHLRPFVYASAPDGAGDYYVEDMSVRYPVRFFTRGARYSIVPGIESDVHVAGVDAPGRLTLAGTDGYGRDVFSRVLHGARVSVTAGLLATLCALFVGTVLGTLAGFTGGVVDRIVMRAADVFMAVPWLYLLFAVRAALPLHLDTRAAFLLLVAVLGVVGWARPSRLVRGIVLSAKERAYVRVAEGFGASPLYVLRRHVLPHTYGVVLTQAGLLVPQFILAEVTLSFLGLGIGEPEASLGSMLGTLQQYHVLASYWWMFAPAIALVAVAAGYHALTSLAHDRARLVAS